MNETQTSVELKNLEVLVVDGKTGTAPRGDRLWNLKYIAAIIERDLWQQAQLTDKDEYIHPAVIPGLVNDSRALDRKDERTHSGQYGFDFDDKNGDTDFDTEDAKTVLSTRPDCVMTYVSRSGLGVHAIIAGPVAANDAEYKQYWKLIRSSIIDDTGLEANNLDNQASDISRLFFLPHDPEIICNWEAKPIQLVLPDAQPSLELNISTASTDASGLAQALSHLCDVNVAKYCTDNGHWGKVMFIIANEVKAGRLAHEDGWRIFWDYCLRSPRWETVEANHEDWNENKIRYRFDHCVQSFEADKDDGISLKTIDYWCREEQYESNIAPAQFHVATPQVNAKADEYDEAIAIVKALAGAKLIWIEGHTGKVKIKGTDKIEIIARHIKMRGHKMLNGLASTKNVSQAAIQVAIEELAATHKALPIRWRSYGLTDLMEATLSNPKVLSDERINEIFDFVDDNLPIEVQCEYIRAFIRNCIARMVLPGCSTQSALILRSIVTGSGKTTAAQMLCLQDESIKHYAEIEPLMYQGMFRSKLYTSRGYFDQSKIERALAGCVWALIDECAAVLGKQSNVEYLSELVTKRRIESDQKYIDEVTIPAQHNVIGTTQRMEFIGDDTGLRRYHICDTSTNAIDLDKLGETIWEMYVATYHEMKWKDDATRDIPQHMWQQSEAGARQSMVLPHWASMIQDLLGEDGHGREPKWVHPDFLSDALDTKMAKDRNDMTTSASEFGKTSARALHFYAPLSRKEFSEAMLALGFIRTTRCRWFDDNGDQHQGTLYLNQKAAYTKRLRKDSNNCLKPIVSTRDDEPQNSPTEQPIQAPTPHDDDDEFSDFQVH